MQRTCPVCLETKDESRFRFSRGGTTRRNVCAKCQGEAETIRIKSEVFAAYGNKCACCGETNPLFLCLDHLKNNGNQHRRETGYITPQMYRLARRSGYPKDLFQLLCHNCNAARAHHGVCPHQSGRTTEVIWAEWAAILARRGKRYRFFQKEKEFVEARPWKSEEMVGNKFYPKSRGERGQFSKEEMNEALEKIERESR